MLNNGLLLTDSIILKIKIVDIMFDGDIYEFDISDLDWETQLFDIQLEDEDGDTYTFLGVDGEDYGSGDDDNVFIVTLSDLDG